MVILQQIECFYMLLTWWKLLATCYRQSSTDLIEGLDLRSLWAQWAGEAWWIGTDLFLHSFNNAIMWMEVHMANSVFVPILWTFFPLWIKPIIQTDVLNPTEKMCLTLCWIVIYLALSSCLRVIFALVTNIAEGSVAYTNHVHLSV